MAKTNGSGRGKLWVIVLSCVAVTIGAGAFAGWWFYFRGDHALDAAVDSPYPPVFVSVKPVVVTIMDGDGDSHFVQIGLNLRVSSAKAEKAVLAMLPEIRDAAMRVLLSRKADDLRTEKGVSQVAEALMGRINAVVHDASGVGPGKALGGPKPVNGVFFSNLVIE